MNILRIPTKEQYAYIEVQFEGSADEALEEYRRLTDLVNGRQGAFQVINTFTGEQVLYDEVSHIYKTLDGKKMLSGSAYKRSLEKPFPLTMAKTVGDKYGMPEEDVRYMWKLNGDISSGFGTSVHKGLELYRKFRHHKNEKSYFLPKNPCIREIVEKFPELDAEGHSEIMVSDVKNLRVGQIDWLNVLHALEKVGIPDDYKSDADIAKNLKGHFHQLSFYAQILIAHGWTIPKVRVWNWDFEKKVWTVYESPVLDLKV